jgi:GNAT superfamily N-acetyltransferase
MIPIKPEISVRPLSLTDVEAVRSVVNENLVDIPYCAPFTRTMVEEQILGEQPATLYPVRWRQNRQLGAWRAGRLIGFIDIATGQDSDSTQLADHEPIGLLRFLALPTDASLSQETADKLLEAAHQSWRSAGIGYVRAFHISTGYLSFQAGAGMLPGEMTEQFRYLTGQGYQLTDRYYALNRQLGELVEEEVPMADLSIVHRGADGDRRYEVYRRRAERIGEARLVCAALENAVPPQHVVYLANIWVAPDWRHRNIGRWILRRMVNDATLEGYTEMLAHVPLNRSIIITLLAQQGFIELNYRGYVLEKSFAE